MMTAKPKEAEGLAKLREPFPPHLISKLPKPTKAQTEAVRADFKKGVRCAVCGSWHHPDVVHLDYVGHAALTDRLLDTDINWTWEPVALNDGLPAFDKNGGLWIKLTVLGVTRLGYGSADGKSGGDAVKEIIGDALRNAAMRFGAALDLWHKGDLHADGNGSEEPSGLREQLEESVRQTPRRDLPFPQGPAKNITDLKAKARELWREIEAVGDDFDLNGLLGDNAELLAQLREALPGWWDGYMKDGTTYPGLCEVIAAKEQEIAERDPDWRQNPLIGG